MTFLLLFLPLTLGAYFASSSLKWRNYILLAASLLFYGWGEPVWIAVMLLTTFVNWLCAAAIEKSRSITVRRLCLAAGVIISLAFLMYFKYAAFFVNSFTGLFGIGLTLPVLKLPIGISFYTFQVLTYTVDVYRGKAPAQHNPLLLLLYVSCFPQLIAGPIVQYSDVAGMLVDRTSDAEGFAEGMRRFVIGLAKKVLLANICGAVLESLSLAGEGEPLSVLGAWYAALMYTFQIYFDFSAYSDMAIGLGRIFGFTYRENFDYPYLSRNITEFWRRWHISLGSFFRDYVYIPLGGNRCSALRNALNLMIVWTLTGLWHGADWNFIVWGAYYGLLILFERFVIGRKRLERIPAVLSVLPTFILTVFGWVLFYYTDISLAAEHLCAMFGADISAGTRAALTDARTLAVVRQYSLFPLIAAVCCLPIVPALKKKLGGSRAAQLASYAAATALLVLSVIFLIGQSYNPFIYFRF